MKIVLTGATGFVGTEVLRQMLQRSDVDEVTCLARRPVTVHSPKLTAIVHEDFAAYDDGLAELLATHAGCVWALGGKASDERNADAYERATYTFTLAFARSVAARLRGPFRFGYLSGMGGDPSGTSRFPWERPTRRLKGRTERDLEGLTREFPHFRATSFRPGGILPASVGSLADFALSPIALRVDRLAAAMIAEVLGSHAEPYRVLRHHALRRLP